jgi:hypothetical protein
MEHECHWSVDGKGLTNLVRQMYCYEDKPLQALDILDCLHGITISQAKNVCTGLARLETAPEGLIQYIEDKDQTFITNYENHARWITTVYLPEKNREEIDLRKAMRETRDRWDAISIQAINNIATALRPGEITMSKAICQKNRDQMEAIQQQDKDKALIPSKETTDVGRFKVPKNLMGGYTQVVSQIRESIRMGTGFLQASIEGIDSMYDLELERQDLHAAICKSLGFDHDAEKKDKDQVDFDNDLYAYLDKHAGSVFRNPDE